MKSQITLSIQVGLFPVKEYSFSEPGRYLIGRAEDCEVQLAALGLVLHRNVSRHHCVLEFDPPMAQLRDLGSRNGTFVNGQLIGQRERLDPREPTPDSSAPAHELQDGDEVQIGDAVFQVRISARAEASLPAIPLMHV